MDCPLSAECDRAEAERDAAVREADRLRHGVPIEGDFVCPDSLALDEAKKEIERLRAIVGWYEALVLRK